MVKKIDITREHAEAARVDAAAALIACPNCASPAMSVKHIGLDAEWKGIYVPGCECGYIEGKGVVKNISTANAPVESERRQGYRSRVE